MFQSETDKKLEAMKEMRVKMKELASESRGKEVLCKQLVGPTGDGSLTRVVSDVTIMSCH